MKRRVDDCRICENKHRRTGSGLRGAVEAAQGRWLREGVRGTGLGGSGHKGAARGRARLRARRRQLAQPWCYYHPYDPTCYLWWQHHHHEDYDHYHDHYHDHDHDHDHHHHDGDHEHHEHHHDHDHGDHHH